MIKNSKYFKFLNKPTNKKLRLFCFPYAGGSVAIYSEWIKKIGDDTELVAIQLPGRSERMFEDRVDNMDKLVDILYKQMSSTLHEPFAFFGHSMGGLIAYALEKKIEQFSSYKAEYIVISATKPLPSSIKVKKHTLSDEDLTQVLREHKASPEEVLNSKEMMEMILPTVRADYKLIETYNMPSSSSLESKLVIFNCEEDIEKDTIYEWQKYFKSDLVYKTFDGGHFFIHSQVDKIIKELNSI